MKYFFHTLLAIVIITTLFYCFNHISVWCAIVGFIFALGFYIHIILNQINKNNNTK